MNAFNTRLFWIYSLAGGFLLLVLYLPLSCTVLSPDYVLTQEYSTYTKKVKRIDSWLAKRGLSHDKIEFYEALAGKRNLNHVRSAKLRDAAQRLLDLDRPITVESAGKFQLDYCQHTFEESLYYCKKYTYFKGDWSIIENPQKIAWLMSGDAQRVSAVLPTIPEEYLQRFEAPAGLVKYESVTHVSGWIKWFVMSFIFASGFFILRMIVGYSSNDEEPFHTTTEMAFSRLVIVGFAPGFLFFTGLHMLTPDRKRAKFHLRRLLRLTSFADEHEALITQLTVMREKALSLKNSDDAVQQIDDALERIRSVKNFEDLSKLHSEAERIDNLYIGITEVEEHLS